MTRSYAHENAANLPGGPLKMDQKADEARSAFDRARLGQHAEQDREAGSDMVRQDAPRPAPRPTPGMAMGADAAAHQHRMQIDRERAAKHMPGGDLDREARKQAFKATRRDGVEARKQDRER